MKIKRLAVLTTALLAAPSMVHAHHVEFMHDKPFLQGLSIPVHGLDHMLVILAVGLIAAQIGGTALWSIPAVFGTSVVIGGVLNLLGVPIPLVETGILASIVLCGVMLAWKPRIALAVTLGIMALFAFLHGHELINNDENLVQNMPLFVIGCVVATLVLQSIGIGLGLLLKRVPQMPLIRFAGVALVLAAILIGCVPSVNDSLIQLIEK